MVDGCLLQLCTESSQYSSFNMTILSDKKINPASSSTETNLEENGLQVMDSVAGGTVSPPILDPELEKQALRRFDLFLLPQLALLTILAYLDRTNIGKHFALMLLYKTTDKNYRKCEGLWIRRRLGSEGK